MPGTFTIRPARADDVDAIHAIEVSSFADPWQRDGFRDLILAGNATVVVAESTTGSRITPGGREAGDDGAEPPVVIGFAVGYAAADEAEIANLAVSNAARRAGVGRALVHHLIALAAKGGAATVFLEVRESNEAARALYGAIGFTELSRRKAYYSNPREDAVVMRLDRSNAVI